MKRSQKKLSDQDVAKILGEAKKESFFDYVALKTLTVLDLRRAELVGQNDHRSHQNPGMLIEKLTDKGVWLRRKKHEEDTFCPIPPSLMEDIRLLCSDRKCKNCKTKVAEHESFCKTIDDDGKRQSPIFGPVFPRTTGWVWYRVQHYAKKAGIADARLIHPHSLRHWATTKAGKMYGVIRARDLAGHANISTTNRYLAASDDKELEEASQDLLEKLEIV